MRWILMAALVWAPTASGATTWLGAIKGRVACPGLGSEIFYDDFTLEMEPGAGTGILTIVGYPPVEVFTDWTVDGKWSYFSASFHEPNGGPYIFNGWIRGNRMRGYVAGHNYENGCMMIGRLKGWL
jgi:hypothetical protein